MTSDERAIRDLIALWMKASREGDTATVLTLMTDDVVFMVPGREPFGKEAFAAAASGMQGMSIDGSSEVREIEIMGDWAFTRSELKVVMTPPGGAPVRREGYAMTIFRRQPDGRWLLARDANLLVTQPARH